MLVMLLALVIVGFLAKDALRAYLGVGAKPKAAVQTATPGERAGAPGAVGVESFDPGSAPPGTGTALERARGVEDMVKRRRPSARRAATA